MAASPFYNQIHTSKKFRLLTRKKDPAGNEYIYLKGVASLAAGNAVTFDEAGVTTLLAANAKGPVAFAITANTSSSNYSWFGVSGTFTATGAANCADNATIGRETSDGLVGDGRAAGDEIANCFSRSATVAAGNLTVQCKDPFVNDFLGA